MMTAHDNVMHALKACAVQQCLRRRGVRSSGHGLRSPRGALCSWGWAGLG
jgi:hypothetical protein